MLGSNAAPNVKFINATFVNFNVSGTLTDKTINVQDADGWEVANCDILELLERADDPGGLRSGGLGHWFHHNYIHDTVGDTYGGRRADNCVWEDNEFYNISSFSPPTSPTQHKFV